MTAEWVEFPCVGGGHFDRWYRLSIGCRSFNLRRERGRQRWELSDGLGNRISDIEAVSDSAAKGRATDILRANAQGILDATEPATPGEG